MKTPREKHHDAEDRRLKKLANAAGYVGASGGWIYRKGTTTKRFYAADGETLETREVETLTPVAQGWRQFERLYGSRVGFVRKPFS